MKALCFCFFIGCLFVCSNSVRCMNENSDESQRSSLSNYIKSATPPEEIEKEEYQTYLAVERISELLWYIIKTVQKNEYLWVEDGRKGWPEPNPFYNQTEQGLFLEFYYGHPSSLWTPLGQIKLIGSCMGGKIWETINEKFLKCLEAEIYKEEKIIENVGHIGPVYKINRIDDFILPCAIERKYNQYEKYEKIKQKWIFLHGYYKKHDLSKMKEIQYRKEI